ncbi:aminotransferase class III-fold pyridoxal phosphate-dependent enzyme [Nocardioides sp.]|uniref:aminotransferase class III-fold pyridoxal phosphate-dependent enzyme n=1 Tax=Nocardioides sp. TaxID=35761 RepID=UPI002ED3E1DE
MSLPAGTGTVLTSAAPRFPEAAISALVRDAYDVEGSVLQPLNSERDQVVLFGGDRRQLVVKLSNESESATNIDLEESAARWAVAADPGLPLSTPLPVRGAAVGHSVVQHPDSGATHFLRAYDRLPGRASLDGAALDAPTVIAYGAMTARTGRALRGFFHPAAGRRVLWHVEERENTRRLSHHIADPSVRGLVETAFDRFEERVGASWGELRAQVVHGDLTLDNVLIDGFDVTGVLDLGDLTHSALVFDIASAFGSLSATLQGDALFRTLRLFLDGYRSVTALEPAELSVLGDTVALRAAVTLCISAWRAAEHPENARYIQAWDDISLSLLRQFDELGHVGVTRGLGGIVPPPETASLTRRRAGVFGNALAPLTYSRPLHLTSGTGATLTDSDGTTYIDAYNNVPVVGHAHPRVSGAVADQARMLSTNLRYLHPRAIELAERLIATVPSGLDTVLFVNSGSEATDLAWRLATAATGRSGALVTEFAYHGVTTAATALSPEEWPGGWSPGHVERFSAPAGPHPDTESFVAAVGRLQAAGHEPALLMVDTAYTSDGILDPGPDYHGALSAAARAAGAVVVADEVQAGFGRTGEQLWSFAGAGLSPDVVTLGKPMGNGYPIAAVVTRGSYVEALGKQGEFFSTFAGSPVAAAAALAVLDVIEDADLVRHAAATGERMRSRLRAATAGCSAVRDVRGRGLLVGVDLAGTPTATVESVVDRVREQGVLIGTTGPRSDVLKIRPPLVVTRAQVDRIVDVVAAAVAHTTQRQGR